MTATTTGATAAAAAGPTLRALPTPFDPPSGPTTVATPSCCCCCCCCLNALAAGAGFTAGAAGGTAATHRRSGVVPILLGLAALPAGIAAASALNDLVGEIAAQVAVATVVLVYAAVSVVALRLAGAAWDRTLLVSLLVPLAAGGLFIVEVFAALFTVFIVELLAPVSFFFALQLGRKTHDETPPTAASPWPPYPTPPSTAVAAGPAVPPPPPPPPPDPEPELPWPAAEPPPADGPADPAGGAGR